jgi:ubiquinone/menaquinone biosynthesis C-methylase UbiE
MRSCRFSAADIEQNYGTPDSWTTFVRQRECEMAFSLESISGRQFRAGLELGGGNGLQSEIIVRHCDRLICTDIVPNSYEHLGVSLLCRKHDRISFELCNAENLEKFSDKQFDLVYSSNVLEHVENLPNALAEIRRVLSDDGLTVHLMPTRHWKVATAVFDLQLRGTHPIHGVSKSHLQEFVRFGRSWWARTFRNHGFEIIETAKMPFYPGARTKRTKLAIRLGNLIGLTTCHLFILRKSK